ncbi:MAG: glycosyltransferase [Lachnospiraceae bacterium]|nr:glycosyltransferase [Lachnospiraceae bacterium]
MRKILFHLNCLEQGGAERVVSTLANAFARDGEEVVVATEWKGENEFALDERVKRVIVGPKESDENRSRAAKVLLRIKYLKECIKEEKPDVVIAFAQNANYRALMTTRDMPEVPVIIAVRTDPVGHYDRPVDKIMIPLTYPRADGSVFQTEGQRDFFPDYIRNNSRIILNPVNDKYLNIPVEQNKEKAIVQSARLVDFKNQPMLIRAFLEVHKRHPDYCLKIYGPDSHDGTREILESIIAENDASGYVHLMGGCDELEKELPKGEIYVLSSNFEGMPNSLLEAMTMGLPVIATDCPCGGPRTVIQSGENGLLIPMDDAEAMTEAICRLIEDKEFAASLGEKARLISKDINSEAVIACWKQYIEEVITAKKSK